MFSPTTNLRLLSTPLESDYGNTLWFPNIAAQTAYFTSKTVKTYANFNYIKKDNTIVVPDEVDNLYNCNYIMYQNSNFGTRWFYAFINRMEWASNGSTRLYVSTDVIQTWFFDITYYQSYVDRCHSDTDVVGDNIVPESFTTGDAGGYQQAGSQDLSPNWVLVYATAQYDGSPAPAVTGSKIASGSGLVYNKAFNQSDLTEVLNQYVKNGTATAISRIQQVPVGNHSPTISFSKYPSAIHGYVPTNKKLLSGAFITNYATMYGQEINFNPVFINGNSVSMQIDVEGTGGVISCIVTNYGSSNVANISMNAAVPEATWAYNQYKNDYNLHSGSNSIYVQRSKENRRFNLYQGALTAAGGALNVIGAGVDLANPVTWAKGGVSAALSSGISGASSILSGAQTTGQIQAGIDEISQDLMAINESYNAPATGGVPASNMFIQSGKTALSYGYKVPPLELVKRCDKYLSVYGYKQSEYRTINLHARLNWTFIKTVSLNASGNFPDEDMKIIKNAFNNGIFFWSYTAAFGNFDQLNPIV